MGREGLHYKQCTLHGFSISEETIKVGAALEVIFKSESHHKEDLLHSFLLLQGNRMFIILIKMFKLSLV